MENKKKNKQKKEPMDKQNLICYVGAFIFFVLAILPFLLRTFDLNYDPEARNQAKKEENPVDKKRLSCNKKIKDTTEGFSYHVEVVNNYEDNIIKNSTIRYKVTINNNSQVTFENAIIEEYKTITGINSKALSYGDENGDTYIIRIDYTLDSGLRQNQLLSRHNQEFDSQRNSYETAGYACTTNDVE